MGPSECSCSGCNGKFAAINGPRHAYLTASPACWARFGQSLALHFSDYRFWPAHQRLTDGYYPQHSGGDDIRAIRSAHIHLASLYAQLVLGQAEDRIIALRKTIANRAFTSPIKPWPAPTADLISVDLRDPSSHLKSVDLYAREVLADWLEHHELADEICGI